MVSKTSIKIYAKKTQIVFGLLLSLLFASSSLNSQNTFYPNYAIRPDSSYIKSYWTATKNIATGPGHWNKKEWIAAGSVVAVGVGLYVFDDEIRHFFQSNTSDELDAISKYGFEPWGSGLYSLPLLGGFYIYGLAAKDNKSRQIAMAGTQAYLMAALSSQLIKHLTNRHRPYQDVPSNPRLWEGPFKGFEYTAFPSGHTTAAFAIATVFASAYSETIWVPIVAYTIASGVGLSRIYDNKHWASDVFIGAALGFAVGKTVFHIMEGNSKLSMGLTDTGVALVYHLR